MKLLATSDINTSFYILVSAILTTSVYSKLQTNLQGCATPEQAFTISDFFPDKVTISNAKTFGITYHGTYKIITNYAANEKYLLYQCGTSPPTGVINGGNYRVVTPIPPSDGVALTSTVQIPWLELLGLRNEIKTYIGYSEYISSPCVKKMINDGKINTVAANEIAPYDPKEGTDLWLQQWEASYPNRIVIDNNFMTIAGKGTKKTMLENGYLEAGSRAEFEWLHFVGALYNREKKAKSIAQDIRKRYDCTASNANISFKKLTNPVKPTAIWAYYSNWPGYEGWMSATCSSKQNYQCEFAAACKIDLLHTSTRMTDPQFVQFAKDADIFIFSSNDWDTFYTPGRKQAVLDQLKSVKNKQVYDHELSGDNTWFEQRYAEYDVVLEDLCKIANLATDKDVHDRLYLRNVFTEQPGKKALGACTDINAPLKSRADTCASISTVDCNEKCKGKKGKKLKKCKKKCNKQNKKRKKKRSVL